MIRLVVFDMAGTTVDENNVVYKTIQKAFIEAGYDITLDLVLYHAAGKEKLQAIKDVFKGVFHMEDDQKAASVNAAFKSMLEQAYNDLEVQPVAGAEDVFAYLKKNGIAVVLNTGYDSKTAHGLLKKLGWDGSDLIDAVVTASDVENSRPYPDMIKLAMKKTGIEDPKLVVKIGDSSIDIEEGQNAGCGFCIGITGGAQTREQMMDQQPDQVIDHLSDLINMVKRENGITS